MTSPATSASVSEAPVSEAPVSEAPGAGPPDGDRCRQTGISSSTGCPVEPSTSLSLSAMPSPAKTSVSAARQTGSVSMSTPSMSRTTASTASEVT